MRLAQISDFHFTRLTWNPFRLFSKRIVGTLNWVLTRKNSFSEEHLAPLPGLFRDLGVEKILFGGDFTSTALEEEFEAAQNFLHACALPWLAIPGNHDNYTKKADRAKLFYRYFSNPASPFPLSLKEDGLEAHSLGGNWWTVLLDTARPTHFLSSKGFFSSPLEERLRSLLSSLPKDAEIVLFNHYPFFRNDSPSRQLERSEALEQIVKTDRRIRAYLHGHTHRHTIADLQPSALPLVLDSGCIGSKLSSTWNLIDLKEEGCSIQGYRYNGTWTPFKQATIAWKRP